MSSSSLLRPPSHLPPATALQLSQQAPTILATSSGAVSTAVLGSLYSASETPELWIVYENLLLSCLRTGDDEAAHHCLGRLVNRFGDENDRIMAFVGLLKEAGAKDDTALDVILKEYEGILKDNPTNIPIAKRRVALLRSRGKLSEAVTALNSLLDFSPADGEAWSELADTYFSQGLYSQAIYALEEVIVLQPNAWNIHARLGEILLMASQTTQSNDTPKQLCEAMKRFSRSVELCDDYLRGYYGLKMSTGGLLNEGLKLAKQTDADDFVLPSTAKLQKLNELATGKLLEIVRRFSAKQSGWQGYDEAEITAARELVERDASTFTR